MPQSDGNGFAPMVEIEEVLRGPDGQAAAKTLIARIDRLMDAIETDKRAGLPSDAYSRVETINKALAAARGIVLGFIR